MNEEMNQVMKEATFEIWCSLKDAESEEVFKALEHFAKVFSKRFKIKEELQDEIVGTLFAFFDDYYQDPEEWDEWVYDDEEFDRTH